MPKILGKHFHAQRGRAYRVRDMEGDVQSLIYVCFPAAHQSLSETGLEAGSASELFIIDGSLLTA